MRFEPTQIVSVFYQPDKQKIPVGRLALKSRKLYFEYDSGFVDSGIQLSPFKLPLGPGVIASQDHTFDCLFGVFNDSLPDGWGRLLLDRNLIKHNINPGTLSVLDRLCFVGSNGMGALVYEPEQETSQPNNTLDLDQIAAEIALFQKNDDTQYIEDLLQLGGSSAGARPKVLVNIDNEEWLVKFRSTNDPIDIGAIEFAYYMMACEAGLETPTAKLFPAKAGPGYYGCKRFDRSQSARTHMHSTSGLLHADHRLPSLDYETILKASLHVTKNMQECLKQFRHCVFNVLSHNRDDHSKNFSLLMDQHGVWKISPAYDLTFSSGPSGEHCTMIMGEGRHPGKEHLLALAETCSIKLTDAIAIIEEVMAAVAKWDHFASDAGVSADSKKMIAGELDKIAADYF
ncbi:MAG: type II toxin-antitoxin system HipA family toxin [Alphaproteobacteria bacterium]